MMPDNINASDVYYKLGEIHAGMRGYDDTLSNHSDRLDKHDIRIKSLEDVESHKSAVSIWIGKNTTKLKVVAILAISLLGAIGKYLNDKPSAQQEKVIQNIGFK